MVETPYQKDTNPYTKGWHTERPSSTTSCLATNTPATTSKHTLVRTPTVNQEFKAIPYTGRTGHCFEKVLNAYQFVKGNSKTDRIGISQICI